MYKKPIRILLIEDSDDDATLLRNEIQRGEFEPTIKQIKTSAELVESLREDWNIVICDYFLPGFSADDALATLIKSNKDIPFIVTSGMIDDGGAIALYKNGAKDFITKDDLSRLNSVIKRELQDHEIRMRYLQSGVTVNRIELDRLRIRGLLQFILNICSDSFLIIDDEFKVLEASNAFLRFIGLDREKVIGYKVIEVFPIAVSSVWLEKYKQVLSERKNSEFVTSIQKFGETVLYRVRVSQFGKNVGFIFSEEKTETLS